jgi:hypothetical protein
VRERKRKERGKKEKYWEGEWIVTHTKSHYFNLIRFL